MYKNSPVKKILVILVLLSIIAAAVQISVRIKAEKQEDTINIVADYYTFQTFANSYGHSVYDAIKELSSNGLTGIAIPEESVQDLVNSGDISLFGGNQLISNSLPNEILQNIDFSTVKNKIKPYYSIIITKDKSLAERIFNLLPEGDYIINGKKTYAVITPVQQMNLNNYGLGFDEDEIAKFKSLGLNIVLRPKYAPGNRNISNLEEILRKYKIRSVMFYGNVISGAGGEQTKELADFFNKNHIVTYIIELPVQKGIYTQEGLDVLMPRTHYYVARVYSIYPAEQLKLKPYEIFNRWFRAVSDRNIRVIYVKPIIDNGLSYEDNMKVNDYEVSKFHSLWKEKGMRFGVPHPMPEVKVPVIILWLISLGITAMFVLYAKSLLDFDAKNSIFWLIILILIFTALIFVSKNLAQKLTALSGAVVITGAFSLIVFRYIKKIYGKKEITNLKNILKHGFNLSIIMLGFSLIGGLWIGASISSTRYLLNLDMFRGVKVLYLTPFLFLILNYLKIFGADFNNTYIPKERYSLPIEIKKAWNITVKWGHIIILIILAGIFLVYLLRSGNTGVSISSLELKFRALLEHKIVARPRFKEFLVGYPSLFLIPLFSLIKRKKWIIVFSISGTMGSISITDTFSHVRNTFLMSLYRSLWGILFGVIIGSIIIVILYKPIINIFTNEK